MHLLRPYGLLVLLLSVGCEPATEWAPAPELDTDGWLMNVWGPSADLLYAVGGSPERGMVVEVRGSEVRPLDLPEGVPLVNWAFGFGAEDVMFVANEGQILHYDGARFEALPTPTEEHLWGVWGASSDDLWAVGGFRTPDSRSVILHWDGAAWADVPLPALDREATSLFKVWGSGPDDVYAVGHVGLVLHWDGAAWSQLTVGAGDDLVAVWGVGPDRVVLVGGRRTGIVSLWDGATWNTRMLGPVAGLNGVWLRNEDVAHAAGPSGGLITLSLTDLSYEHQRVPEGRTFHSIFGADNHLIAVGGTIGLPPPYEGMAFRRNLAADE